MITTKLYNALGKILYGVRKIKYGRRKVFCPKCRRRLIPSELWQYKWQCLNCDEDFFNIEVT